MINIHLKVTHEDIFNGVVKDCEKCPVALALQRAVGKNIGIYVEGGTRSDIKIYLNESEFILDRDNEQIAEFIDQFDREIAVEPFECDLTFVENDDY